MSWQRALFSAFLLFFGLVSPAAGKPIVVRARANFFQPSMASPYGCSFSLQTGKALPVRFGSGRVKQGGRAERISVSAERNKLKKERAALQAELRGAGARAKRRIQRRLRAIAKDLKLLGSLNQTCHQFDPRLCFNNSQDPLEIGIDCGGSCTSECRAPQEATPSPTPTSTPTPTATPTPASCLLDESRISLNTPQIESRLSHGRLVMSDVSDPQNPQQVITESHVPLSFSTSLVPVVTFQTARNGADITLTYTNSSGVAQPMGKIGIAGLELGRFVQSYDFRQGSLLRRRDMSRIGDGPEGRWWADHSAPGAAYDYPNDLFSPVAVVHGEDSPYTLGISLQYPVLEYKQVIRVQLNREFNDPRSDITFWLLDDLPAGETRSYTVSVRVISAQDNWVRTLVPYRNYFRAQYGGVRYDRDPRPIYGPNTAQLFMLSEDNPYGYLNASHQRPDVYGWAPWTNIILDLRTYGFQRAMLWAPTGLYSTDHGGDYNFPQLFMTPMLDRPMMRDTMSELLRIPAAGMQMGYYQGYAGMIHWDWNNPNPTPLDITNPQHLERAFAEFDLAMTLHPEFIGMDAIALLPLWDALRYTELLEARAPSRVRFLGELSPSDLWLQRHASFVFAHQAPGTDNLADFLLPGHEIWAGIRYDVLYPGQFDLPEETILSVLRQTTQEGRIGMPLSLAHMPNPEDYYAAKSWERTVPAELQDPCYPLEHPAH